MNDALCFRDYKVRVVVRRCAQARGETVCGADLAGNSKYALQDRTIGTNRILPASAW